MPDPRELNQPREDRLNELIADYLRRVDRGEQVDPEQLVGDHPDLADSFRQYLRDAALADQFEQHRPASAPAGKDTAESRAGEETIPPSHVVRSEKDVANSRQFGRYRIIRQLGQGAMGSVYLAEDPKLERQVALKIPKLHDADDPESLERFYREARAAATLNHRNICQVHDIGEQDGMPFIAMAYIEGQPLSQLVGKERMRSEREIAELVRKIALALSEAHNKGVVHRDLKSGNILVDGSNEPVVTDFGLARRIDKPGDERLTKSGTLLGTPAYMAPEQVEGDLERIGPRSDIYSLGVILYELITGQLPFSGPVAALIAQILRDEPRPPSALRTPVNKRLEAICLKMMAKSPDARFGSAAEVAEALGELLGQTAKHPAAAQAATETIRKLEAHRQRTMQLLQASEFSQAIDALERMARLHGPGADEYAAWAKRELARVKVLPRELLEKGPAVVETAVELIAAHEYARAAELLRSVPDVYRSTEATKLLAKATNLENEAQQLNARAQQAIGTRQYDGLQDDLNRLLEIQPGNLTARELHAKLSTYSPGQSYRFDKSGNLLPAHRTPLLSLLGGIVRQSLSGYARRQQYRTDSKGRKVPAPADAQGRGIPILPVAITLGAVAIIVLAIVIFLRDDGQSVRVEIDEEILADSSITLLIDGNRMEIAGLGDTINLKPGPHGYQLRRGDAVVRSGKFTVLKGDNPALEISLDRGASETTVERTQVAARRQTGEPSFAIAHSTRTRRSDTNECGRTIWVSRRRRPTPSG
jgi:tRNA A-37 threonylcarbamoyl transferase component Bud32